MALVSSKPKLSEVDLGHKDLAVGGTGIIADNLQLVVILFMGHAHYKHGKGQR